MERKLRDLLKNDMRLSADKVSISDCVMLKNPKAQLESISEAPVELQIKEGFEHVEGTKFEVYKGKDDKMNFHYKETDGNILLSGSGYDNLTDCLDAIESVRESCTNIVNSSLLTAVREKPDFVRKKAAPVYKSLQEEQEQLLKRSIGFGFFIQGDGKKRPSFISGRISDKKIISGAQAIKALNNLHYTMGFENAEQEYMEEGIEIRHRSGTDFYRMKQYHRGIPVHGRMLILSTDKEGNSRTLSGHYVPISCDDDVIVTEEQAMAITQKRYGQVLDSEGLTYYTDHDGKAYLCWCINTEKYAVYISTVNGDVIYKALNIISIDINTDRSIQTLLYETDNISILNKDGGAPYILYDGARNIEIYNDYDDKSDAEPVEVVSVTLSSIGTVNIIDSHAETAYSNIKKVYDYYRNVLGRKGADNKGKKIRIIVNDFYFNGEVNACFYNKPTEFTKIGISALGGMERCLDVVGHEFTHAVSRAIWDPIYSNESGALDEAYADIMGEFIQDEELDQHRENSPEGPGRYFKNGYTMDDYKYEKPTDDNDHGYVHTYCKIITHTAYLMQQKWPEGYGRYELSALFYNSMEYLPSDSIFDNCFYALLYTMYDIMPTNMNQKLGALADAFLETRIMNSLEDGTREVTGTVTDKNSGEPVPAAIIAAYYRFEGVPVAFTISNSRGEYCLKLKDGAEYSLRCQKADSDMMLRDTSAISSKNCGPFNFIYTKGGSSRKKIFFISGNVIHPNTGKAISGATIKILKGRHTEGYVTTMKPDVVLKTDADGNFFTAALPQGQYDVWAYAADSKNYCLSQIFNVDNSKDTVINFCPTRRKRYYVTGISICFGDTEKAAKNARLAGYTLIDVDLNKKAGGSYIYLTYRVDNFNDPVTNLLIFESKKKQTWDTRELIYKNIMASYTRIDLNLNKGAGGKFLYLCFTTDKRYAPLTNLDVIEGGKNVVREPYWSGIRVVRDSNMWTDSYANLNAGADGSDIYILQTKREII